MKIVVRLEFEISFCEALAENQMSNYNWLKMKPQNNRKKHNKRLVEELNTVNENICYLISPSLHEEYYSI